MRTPGDYLRFRLRLETRYFEFHRTGCVRSIYALSGFDMGGDFRLELNSRFFTRLPASFAAVGIPAVGFEKLCPGGILERNQSVVNVARVKTCLMR